MVKNTKSNQQTLDTSSVKTIANIDLINLLNKQGGGKCVDGCLIKYNQINKCKKC